MEIREVMRRDTGDPVLVGINDIEPDGRIYLKVPMDWAKRQNWMTPDDAASLAALLRHAADQARAMAGLIADSAQKNHEQVANAAAVQARAATDSLDTRVDDKWVIHDCMFIDRRAAVASNNSHPIDWYAKLNDRVLTCEHKHEYVAVKFEWVPLAWARLA